MKKKIVGMTLIMVFISGCSFNMDKFKWNKDEGTVEIEKVETKKKCQTCH